MQSGAERRQRSQFRAHTPTPLRRHKSKRHSETWHSNSMAVESVRFLAVARVADRTLVAAHAVGGERASRARYVDKAKSVLSSAHIDLQPRLTIADNEVGSIHYSADAAALYLGRCSVRLRSCRRFLTHL